MNNRKEIETIVGVKVNAIVSKKEKWERNV